MNTQPNGVSLYSPAPLSNPSDNYLVIPKSSLGYATNNQYPLIPPFMSDGRSVFASWQPEAVVNENIIKENNIQSNWEYRQFMMRNGLTIMEYNKREACNDAGYYKRYVASPAENIFSPSSRPVEPSTDLKSMYLTREKLQSQRISREIKPEQLQSVGASWGR